MQSELNLLLHYDFEGCDATNGVVFDRSPNGLNGQLVGSARCENYLPGHHALVPGGRGFVRAKANPMSGRTAGTVATWFWCVDPTRNFKLAAAATWPPGKGWILGTHYPEVWSDDGRGIGSGAERAHTFVPQHWNHLALVYDGTTLIEYINGRPAQIRVATGAPIASVQSLTIGGWEPYPGYNFLGGMSDFRIFAEPLFGSHVRGLIAATQPPEISEPTVALFSNIAPTLAATQPSGLLLSVGVDTPKQHPWAK